ncbi:MAG: nucleotidyltransferase family protein, partial [Segetibacter sp.]|nr:nucleotidyltransferase family protein [Segetibacter sp.]
AIIIVGNKGFKDGIASSIKAGLTCILDANNDCEDVILMVCDQPYVDGSLLKKLLETKHTTNKPMVACAYKNTVGVPALFDKRFFPELLSLQAEEGGKKVLLKHLDLVASIPFPVGDIDIDTAADYEALISENKKL